jgi:hypothetical protein
MELLGGKKHFFQKVGLNLPLLNFFFKRYPLLNFTVFCMNIKFRVNPFLSILPLIIKPADFLIFEIKKLPKSHAKFRNRIVG